MPISHGHKPYEYNEFIPEMDASNLIQAVKVKQNMYDEGTQIIQAKLDQLSGLDILRDVDRQYANQELSKIYKTVQENAHADFSNPNTVKSFLNMVRPLEKDKILENAVVSTAEFRRRQSTLDEIRKKDPSAIAPQNVDDYMEDVDGWFNDPNQGAYLNRREYNPYIDNSKKYMQLVKALTPQIRQEILSGNKFIDSVTLKTLTDQRVSEAVRQQLSASELNQLYMDGKYKAKGMDTNTKYNSLYANYSRSIQDNLSASEDRSKTLEERQEAYNTAMADQAILGKMEEARKNNDTQYVNDLFLNGYVNSTIEGIGKVYAYEQEVKKRESNPYGLANHNHALKMKQLEQEAEYSGEIVRGEDTEPQYNDDGTLVRDYNYIKAKKSSKNNSSTNPEEEDFRFMKREDSMTKYQLGKLKDDEELLINPPLGKQNKVKVTDMDQQFNDMAMSALKYITHGDIGDYEDTFGENTEEMSYRFESFIDEDGKKQTKITIVDDDFGWFRDNISFTLIEAARYAELYDQKQLATKEQIENAK